MKSIGIITLFILATSFQAMAQNVGHESGNPNKPGMVCIPEGETNWPVKGMYLHGWFTAHGTSMTHSRRTEFENRRYLLDLARRMRIRIAMPVAPRIHSNGNHTWGGVGLAEIESLSRQACDGAPLAPDRSLFGYSSGGFAAKNVGQLPCNQLRNYRRVLAIGTQNHYPDRCGGIFHSIYEHVFPPSNFVEASGLEPEPVESSPPQSPVTEELPFLTDKLIVM